MNTVRRRGPLFDGRAAAAVEVFLEVAKEEVAEAGVNLVRQRLAGSLVNPTGFYEAHIATENRQDDVLVTDSDVVYGPWLEGVSNRNAATAFKGYSSFRRAAQDLQAEAPDIAESVLGKYLPRMG